MLTWRRAFGVEVLLAIAPHGVRPRPSSRTRKKPTARSSNRPELDEVR